MKFTYSAYADLITLLKGNGYEVGSYHNDKMGVILRHDVDSDLSKALEFAKLEHDLGVHATYFVLMTSKHYNVLARESIEIIQEISTLGHEIGLHFDEVNYDNLCVADLMNAVQMETTIMRQVLGLPIMSVSMHRPSKKTLESDYVFEGLVNSYSQKYFKEYKYVSDSRMYWRENVEEVVASGKYEKLHILTHPFWYSENEHTMHDVVQDFCLKANGLRYDCLSENMRDLGEVLARAEITG